MKQKLPWIIVALLAITLAAVLASERRSAAPAAQHVSTASEKKILYWVDPMHPQYKSDKPGKAPDCGMDLVPVYADGAARAAVTVNGHAPVALSAQRQQLIGVQTGVVMRRAVGQNIRAVGRVAVDETRVAKVTTKFDGYIERLYVDFTGKRVSRGQALFSVYSPDLLSSQQEYLLALRTAKQVPEVGNTLLQSARQRLLLWDMSPGDIRQLERSGVPKKSVTIYSPASGVVTNKMAVAGARVMPGEPLFDITSLDRVWVLADVYESELPLVKLGAPATVTLSYLPGRSWTGRVTFIAPDVDPMTRTTKVRVELDNRDGALKPEMFADVTISEPQHDVLTVPDSAVLQSGTRSIVFVVKNDGTFEPREVQLGAKGGDYYEVRSGVTEGEKVATQANFLIDSESRLKSALSQMSGGGQHAH